jgi:hypothetical protein
MFAPLTPFRRLRIVESRQEGKIEALPPTEGEREKRRRGDKIKSIDG